METHIGCSQSRPHPEKKETIDDWVIEKKRALARIEGKTSFGYEAFETRRGQKGIKYWYTIRIPPNSEMNSVGFVIPTPLGRLQFLCFWYPPDRHDELEPIFEHVGRSFVVK